MPTRPGNRRHAAPRRESPQEDDEPDDGAGQNSDDKQFWKIATRNVARQPAQMALDMAPNCDSLCLQELRARTRRATPA